MVTQCRLLVGEAPVLSVSSGRGFVAVVVPGHSVFCLLGQGFDEFRERAMVRFSRAKSRCDADGGWRLRENSESDSLGDGTIAAMDNDRYAQARFDGRHQTIHAVVLACNPGVLSIRPEPA